MEPVAATKPEAATGHRVGGIVAQAQALAGIAADRGLGRPIPLAQGVAPLPIDGVKRRRFGRRCPGSDAPVSLLSFEYSTPAVLATLTESSVGHRLASIETDHHGGTGGQGAVVRDGGRVVTPPTRGDGPRGPVGRALAHPGVRVGPAHTDEFDEVGLGTSRSNDGWRGARAPR